MLPVATVVAGRRLRRQLTRALVSGGFEVAPLELQQADLEQRLAAPTNLFLIDADQDLDRVKGIVRQLRRHHPDTAVLVLTREVANKLLVHMLTTEGLSNLVARHTGVDDSVDKIDERELLVTARKLVDHDIFGLDKYLSTWGMQTHHRTIGSVTDKNLAVADLDDYLHEIDCYRAIATSVSMVAEELLMNALFDAPVDASGTPKYVHIERDQPLVLEPSEQAELSFGCNGHYIGLRVSDPFGALERDVIIAYLKRAFLGARGKLREGPSPGAGLGLFMTFNSITQLVFNIAAGTHTEVIALFYIRGGVRVFRSAGRSLNIFLAPPQVDPPGAIRRRADD